MAEEPKVLGPKFIFVITLFPTVPNYHIPNLKGLNLEYYKENIKIKAPTTLKSILNTWQTQDKIYIRLENIEQERR